MSCLDGEHCFSGECVSVSLSSLYRNPLSLFSQLLGVPCLNHHSCGPRMECWNGQCVVSSFSSLLSPPSLFRWQSKLPRVTVPPWNSVVRDIAFLILVSLFFFFSLSSLFLFQSVPQSVVHLVSSVTTESVFQVRTNLAYAFLSIAAVGLVCGPSEVCHGGTVCVQGNCRVDECPSK